MIIQNGVQISNGLIMGETAPLTSGLQLYLDATSLSSYSGSGSTWYDLSGNGNNSTLVSSPTYTTIWPYYFAFNGSTQYAQTVNTIPSSTTGFTLTAWIKKTGSTYAFLLVQPAAQATGFGFELYPTTAYINCQTSSLSDYSEFSWNQTGWHEWTAVFDGSGVGNTGRLNVYVDGVNQSMTYTGTIGTTLLASGANTFQINRRPWTGTVGQSDFISVLMYNRALSAEEVQINYTRLRALYRL